MSEAAVDVTVKTRFASARALMQVVSLGIERGALRLPAQIAAGRTFEIALVTAAGEVAVRGTAEALRSDGDTTLVRFLSATEDGSNRDAWVELDDAVVVVAPALAPRPRPRSRSNWLVATGTPPPVEPPPPVQAAAPRLPQLPVPPRRGRAAVIPVADTAPPVLAPLAVPASAGAPPPMTTPVLPPPVPPVAPSSPAPVAASPGAVAAAAVQAPLGAVPLARLRPATLPPARDAAGDRGWFPLEPSMAGLLPRPALGSQVPPPTAAPPVEPVAAARPTRGPRAMLLASICIAGAGAAVAISAVVWASSVAGRASAPAAASSPTATAPALAGPAPARVAAPAEVAAPAAPPGPAPAAGALAAAAPPPAAGGDEPPPVAAPAPPIVAPPPAPPVPAAAAAGPGRCEVAVTTTAERVGVFLDGRKLGETPAVVTVPCAPVILTLRHPRYAEQVRRVEPSETRTELHAVMARPKAQLRVVTRPSGATVIVDGRTVGRSPVTAVVDGFERSAVTLRAPGMVEERRTVYAKAGSTMVFATLKKK
ncbi:MAG: PEGA domain-containing protein [Kofleriaceae bacterium]